MKARRNLCHLIFLGCFDLKNLAKFLRKRTWMKNGNNVEYLNEYSNLRSSMRKHILSTTVTNIQSWCIYFFATKHNFRFIPSPPKATFALLCPKTCQRGKSCNSQSLHVSSVLTYSSKDAYEYELRSRTKILYSMNWIFRKRTWIKKI